MQLKHLVRGLEYALLLTFTIIVSGELYTVFTSSGFALSHDEAEHLHVIFALYRGERPYLDFIENHPVFLHALISLVVDQLPESAIALYSLLKGIIALHCVGTILLFCHATAPLLKLQSRLHTALAFLIAISLLGVWANPRQSYPIWTLRPDWICYFYAVLCVYLYQNAIIRQLLAATTRARLITFMALGGVSGGLATAILPKSAYLFIPCAVTVAGLLLSTEWGSVRTMLRQHWRRLLLGHIVFLFSLFATAGACIWLELSISRVSAEVYYLANFAFNSSKHIPYASVDTNPASMLVQISGLSLVGVIGLGLFVYLALLRWRKTPDPRTEAILLFCLTVIVLNAVLPSFSNGLTWAHYFIPSLLALVVLFAYVLTQAGLLLQRLVAARYLQERLWLKHLVLILLLGQTAIFVASRGGDVNDRINGLQKTKDLYELTTGDRSMELLPDRYLPDDLSYLTRMPQSKPIRARAWSYYFMLYPDAGAFVTMHALGLAPPIRSHWRKLFKESPPDAILLPSEDEVKMLTTITQIAGNGDLSWLWDEIQPTYSCRRRQSIQLFVRNDLLHRFPRELWAECTKRRENDEP